LIIFNLFFPLKKEHFSNNKSADRIRQVQGDIEQVKDVMVHNIGKFSFEGIDFLMILPFTLVVYKKYGGVIFNS